MPGCGKYILEQILILCQSLFVFCEILQSEIVFVNANINSFTNSMATQQFYACTAK